MKQYHWEKAKEPQWYNKVNCTQTKTQNSQQKTKQQTQHMQEKHAQHKAYSWKCICCV